jgi:hypothetical protein
LAYFKDFSEFTTTIGSLFTTVPNAELDFLALDDDFRPELFKFVDGNDINGARSLLADKPSLVSDVLPNEGWTSLHFAARLGRAKFIPFLVKDHGIDPDIRCGSGNFTPLHQAVSVRSVEAAKALLDYGADINLTFYGAGTNYTALEFSIEKCMDKSEPNEDDLEMIRFLLSREADYLRNFDGNDSRHLVSCHCFLLSLFFLLPSFFTQCQVKINAYLDVIS